MNLLSLSDPDEGHKPKCVDLQIKLLPSISSVVFTSPDLCYIVNVEQILSLQNQSRGLQKPVRLFEFLFQVQHFQALLVFLPSWKDFY